MTYVDAHSHYNLEDYIFDKLDFSNYGFVINNGLDSKTNRECIDLVDEKIKAAFGWHPLNVNSQEDLEKAEKELDKLKSFSSKVVAIGEIGLDYYHVKEDDKKELQKKVFEIYLKAAQHWCLPVIIHARNSAKDVLEIIKKLKDDGSFEQDVVLHCFEASEKNIELALGMGCYFTIPASVGRNEFFQRLVDLVPVDKMFTETDAPYQGPEKGVSAKPSDVKFAIDYIAEKKGLDPKEVENMILANYLRLF